MVIVFALLGPGRHRGRRVQPVPAGAMANPDQPEAGSDPTTSASRYRARTGPCGCGSDHAGERHYVPSSRAHRPDLLRAPCPFAAPCGAVSARSAAPSRSPDRTPHWVPSTIASRSARSGRHTNPVMVRRGPRLVVPGVGPGRRQGDPVGHGHGTPPLQYLVQVLRLHHRGPGRDYLPVGEHRGDLSVFPVLPPPGDGVARYVVPADGVGRGEVLDDQAPGLGDEGQAPGPPGHG